MACLPDACLPPVCLLPARLPACLPARQPACLPTCLPSCLPACLMGCCIAAESSFPPLLDCLCFVRPGGGMRGICVLVCLCGPGHSMVAGWWRLPYYPPVLLTAVTPAPSSTEPRSFV